jgi:hypothetical protein
MVFVVDGAAVTRRVYECHEPLAAGDLPGLGLSGYVKPAMPLHEQTHTRDTSGQVQIGRQKWYYMVSLPLPGKPCTVVLPPDDALLLQRMEVRALRTALPAHDFYDAMEPRETPQISLPAAPQMRLRKARLALRNAWNCVRFVLRRFARVRLEKCGEGDHV